MGLFGFLRGKKKEEEVGPQIVKVDFYENQTNLLQLMAAVAGAKVQNEIGVFREKCHKGLEVEGKDGKTFLEFWNENRHLFGNLDFLSDLDDKCRELELLLTAEESGKYTRIVVAGGFSSGKSSFLNRITGSQALLPTGVEPVSVVTTYLSCSSELHELRVRGVNQKHAPVILDVDVLRAIQHGSKSNIYLASVLERLMVEVPSTRLDGLLFIDTPGYNNSDKVNASNGTTDRETAERAMGEGDVLFWLVDASRGTLVKEDIAFIKTFRGRKLFIFNKSDKLGKAEAKQVVENANRLINKEFSVEEVIDVMAYSTLDDEVYYSVRGYSIDDIINEVRNKEEEEEQEDRVFAQIGALFDAEVDCFKSLAEIAGQEYNEHVDGKDSAQRKLRELEEQEKNMEHDLATISELLDLLPSALNEMSDAANFYGNSVDALARYNNGKFWSSSTIDEMVQEMSKGLGAHVKKLNEMVDQNNNASIHEGFFKSLWELMGFMQGSFEAQLEYYKEDCGEDLAQKQRCEGWAEALEQYKVDFISSVRAGMAQYRRQGRIEGNDLSYLKQEVKGNVFDAIASGRYSAFERCFSLGVDVNACNDAGYSVLTYAVMSGNNDMVRFLLEHGADASRCDKRGHNAFHTAVLHNYRDLCDMLLERDASLAETIPATGETMDDLVNKEPFGEWLKERMKQ